VVKVHGVFKGATETRDVPSGSVIFETGDDGEEMFGIVEGRVELRVPGGRVFELGPDDCFGEMALVDRALAARRPSLRRIRRWPSSTGGPSSSSCGRRPRGTLQVMSSLAERLRARG
jgi:CRP-like cAMP-binding protein